MLYSKHLPRYMSPSINRIEAQEYFDEVDETRESSEWFNRWATSQKNELYPSLTQKDIQESPSGTLTLLQGLTKKTLEPETKMPDKKTVFEAMQSLGHSLTHSVRIESEPVVTPRDGGKTESYEVNLITDRGGIIFDFNTGTGFSWRVDKSFAITHQVPRLTIFRNEEKVLSASEQFRLSVIKSIGKKTEGDENPQFFIPMETLVDGQLDIIDTKNLADRFRDVLSGWFQNDIYERYVSTTHDGWVFGLHGATEVKTTVNFEHRQSGTRKAQMIFLHDISRPKGDVWIQLASPIETRLALDTYHVILDMQMLTQGYIEEPEELT